MTRRNQAIVWFLCGALAVGAYKYGGAKGSVVGNEKAVDWFHTGTAEAATTPADRFDVLGIKIGMSLAQSVKILHASGPSYMEGGDLKDIRGLRYFPQTDPGGSSFTSAYNWTANSEPPAPTTQITLALQGPSGHESVSAIHRLTSFRSVPELAGTVDKLKEKYGTTTAYQTEQAEVGAAIEEIVWVYSPTGEAQSSIAPQSGNYYCAVATPPMPSLGILGGHAKSPVEINSDVVPAQVPDSIQKEFENCDFIIRARLEVGILAASSTKVVKSIDIDLFDGRFFLAGLLARQNWAKAALDAQSKNAAQKTKANVTGVNF